MAEPPPASLWPGALVSVVAAGCAVGGGLPTTVGAWRRVDPPRRYDRKTIYDYMDGAAEVYRMHGFRALEVWTYRRADGAALKLEIFDMGSPQGAFGAFSHARDLEGETVAAGEDGHYLSGVLWLWKGVHLVCVSSRLTKPPRPALEELAARVAAALPRSGQRPALVGLLPREGLRGRTVRYFRVPAALAYHYGEVDASLVELKDGAEAVLADYRREAGASVMLVARYPDAARARRARDRLRRGFLGTKTEDLGRRPGGRWAAAAVEGALLWVVLEAPTGEEARQLLAEGRRISRGKER